MKKVFDRTRGYFVSRWKKPFAEVSLSRRTVERQIDAIAVIIKVASGKVAETSVAFSIALDESTDIIDTELLVTSIHEVVQKQWRSQDFILGGLNWKFFDDTVNNESCKK